MDADQQDELTIRSLIERWAIFRDSAQWERLRSIWHMDGRMTATWFRGSAVDFIAASRAGWERGSAVSHFLGGSWIDVHGDRAIAQTRMVISQRAQLGDIPCDCACTGRFYDFFERRAGEWRLWSRFAIYERDRIDPVEPMPPIQFDREKLLEYPEGYRHLAYLQRSAGMSVSKGLPGLRGPEVEALYAEGAAWLTEAPASGGQGELASCSPEERSI